MTVRVTSLLNRQRRNQPGKFGPQESILVHNTSFLTYDLFFFSCRKVFVFLQKTVAMLAKSNPELGVKLYLQTALAADTLAALGRREEFGPIMYELILQAFSLYEEEIGDSKAQSRNIKALIGTLMACRALSNEEYESLIPKAAQYSAKLLKKPDQCQMVALCAHLFYTTREGVSYEVRV